MFVDGIQLYVFALDSWEAKRYPEGLCPHSYFKKLILRNLHTHAAMRQLIRIQRVNQRRRGSGMVLGSRRHSLSLTMPLAAGVGHELRKVDPGQKIGGMKKRVGTC